MDFGMGIIDSYYSMKMANMQQTIQMSLLEKSMNTGTGVVENLLNDFQKTNAAIKPVPPSNHILDTYA